MKFLNKKKNLYEFYQPIVGFQFMTSITPRGNPYIWELNVHYDNISWTIITNVGC